MANRMTAVVAASGPAQSIGVLPVGGNDAPTDPVVSRIAGKTEAGTAAGDGDHGGVSSGQSGRDSGQRYSAEERIELQRLRARDREVRAHELAHLAAAGRHARGGASFSFESGPDGRRYAVAGEVSIDTSAVAGDPAATLAKAQQVRRAALAPAEPSAQDRQIAAEAATMAARARIEMARERDGPADPATGTAAGQDRPYAASADNGPGLIELIA